MIWFNQGIYGDNVQACLVFAQSHPTNIVFSPFKLFSHCISLSVFTQTHTQHLTIAVLSNCYCLNVLILYNFVQLKCYCEFKIEVLKNLELPMQWISLKVQHPSICLLFGGAHLHLEKMLLHHYCRHRILRHAEACSCIQWHVTDIPIKIQVIIICLPNWITVFDIILNWTRNLSHFQLYYLLNILPSHPTPFIGATWSRQRNTNLLNCSNKILLHLRT